LKIPRIDVGYSALIGAVTALVGLAFSTYVLGIPPNPVALATLPVLVVTAVMGVAAYLTPTYKELVGTCAGVIVVLVEAYLTSRRGGVIDVGSVTAALTFLVQTFFLFVLPRIRVYVDARASDQVQGTAYTAEVDAA
jgi:hypothetical protein